MRVDGLTVGVRVGLNVGGSVVGFTVGTYVGLYVGSAQIIPGTPHKPIIKSKK